MLQRERQHVSKSSFKTIKIVREAEKVTNYTVCLECGDYEAKTGYCSRHNIFFLNRPIHRQMSEVIKSETGESEWLEKERVIGCRTVSATDVCVATIQIYINEMNRKAPTL